MRWLLVLISLALAGCAQRIAYAVYDIRLQTIERPTDAARRYGPIQVTEVPVEEVRHWVFTDGLIEARWDIAPTHIRVAIDNRTDYSIKVLWNEAAFVDERGLSHRIFYDTIRFVDRTTVLPPSVIVQRGRVQHQLFPVSYVRWEVTGWVEDPILPEFWAFASRRTEVEREVAPYRGKTLKVLLPLQIQDVVNEYLFTFAVADVRVVDGFRPGLLGGLR